jgi:RNA polymerase sigma-70 factor (ECF subfamily)
MEGIVLIPRNSSQPILTVNVAEQAYEYAELFAQYQQPLIRYLYGMVKELETARDLAQETFVRGYEMWLQAPQRHSWRPLLYKIATNCALDWLRRHSRIRFSSWDENEDTNNNADVAWQRCETVTQALVASQLDDESGRLDNQVAVRLAVIETLRQMAPEAATCLLLYYDQGFSSLEIANIMGSSLDATWQRLNRARRLFCNLYRKEQVTDA